MIDLTLRNSTSDRTFGQGFFKTIVSRAAQELGLARDLGLSLTLVGRQKIRSLNKEHQGKDAETDVLSFPLNRRGKSDSHGILELGDIFICLPVAFAQARAEGVPPRAKLSFLTVHGFLHLLGYDHETSAKDRKRMFSLQDRILRNL